MKRHVLILIIFALITSVLPTTSGRSFAALAPTNGSPSGQVGGNAQPVEVPSLRTQTSRTYQEGDHYVSHLYPGPVNYRDSSGAWQPIDNTLVPSTRSGFAYVNKADSYAAYLPSDIGSGSIHVETSGGWVELGLTGVHGTLSVSGTAASYAVPGATISYALGATALKESITLTGPTSPSTFVYSLRTSSGLTARSNANGGIDVVDSSGTTQFSFAPPSMADQAGKSSQAVSMTMGQGSSGQTVTVAADSAWLSDSARQWPVVIDPTIYVLNPTAGCTLNQAAPTTASCTNNYVVSNVSGQADHTILQFNLSSIPSNAAIQDANLAMYLYSEPTGQAASTVSIYQMTRPWFTVASPAATWNTSDGTTAWTTPGGDHAASAAWTNPSVGGGTGYAGWYHWNPVALVQGWVNGTIANDGLLAAVTAPAGSTLDFYSAAGSVTNQPSLTVAWMPWSGAQPYWTFDGGVNVANGNLVLSQSDLTMPGIGLPLAVGRSFNSRIAGSVTDFGGWTSDTAPDVSLYVYSDGDVAFYGPSGTHVPFVINAPPQAGTNTFTSPPGIEADLTSYGGVYDLTFHQSRLQLQFSSGGYLTAMIDRSGNTISYGYDGSNRLTTITDTQGRTTTFAYTSPVSSTLVSQITDPAGRTYGYAYDSNKNLTTYTNPAGKSTQYAYDSSHNLTQITDPNGSEVQFTYDGSRRVTEIKAVTNTSTGAGNTTTYTYNSGNTVVTDPNNHSTTYTYDALGRVTSVTDPKSNTWQTSWTSDNQVASTTTPSNHTTSYTYDSLNNLTTVTLPTSPQTTESWAYTNTSWPYQPSSSTDEQGHTTAYGYNSQGITNSVTDASNHISTVVYNSNGTIQSETDANNHSTTYSYNSSGTSIGLPLKDTPPSPLGTTQYGFNSANLETSVTDGNNKQTTYTYDALGRVLTTSYADGSSITYQYDAGGNLTSMTDGTGTTTYSYNTLDELTGKRLPTDPYLSDGESVDYTYDAVGNLLTKQDSGGTVTYGYDQNDQVTSVHDRGNRAYTVGYDQDGNQTSILFPNNVTQTAAYNTVGQLSQVSAKTSTNQTLTSYSYTYTNPSTNQPTGTPYGVTDTQGNTTSYSYDTSSQMTQAVQKSSGGSTLATYGFGYDAGGNLTSKSVNGTSTTFAYNAADELTSASGGMSMTYSYDGNGDRTGTSNGTAININAAGQLTSITPPGGSAIPYSYTGTGEQQRVGAGTNKYQYDATGLNVQTDASNNSTYFTSLPDGTLLSETIPSGGANSGTYYYLGDGAGNVAALVDSTGTVRNSYAYDPMGNATLSGSAAVSNPFTFQGGVYDSQTGYYYTGSNYYDPATGQSFGCQDTKANEDKCGEDEWHWKPAQLKEHWENHGPEFEKFFPDFTEKEYEQLGINLLSSKENSIDSGGDAVYGYDYYNQKGRETQVRFYEPFGALGFAQAFYLYATGDVQTHEVTLLMVPQNGDPIKAWDYYCRRQKRDLRGTVHDECTGW